MFAYTPSQNPFIVCTNAPLRYNLDDRQLIRIIESWRQSLDTQHSLLSHLYRLKGAVDAWYRSVNERYYVTDLALEIHDKVQNWIREVMPSSHDQDIHMTNQRKNQIKDSLLKTLSFLYADSGVRAMLFDWMK